MKMFGESVGSNLIWNTGLEQQEGEWMMTELSFLSEFFLSRGCNSYIIEAWLWGLTWHDYGSPWGKLEWSFGEGDWTEWIYLLREHGSELKESCWGWLGLKSLFPHGGFHAFDGCFKMSDGIICIFDGKCVFCNHALSCNSSTFAVELCQIQIAA